MEADSTTPTVPDEGTNVDTGTPAGEADSQPATPPHPAAVPDKQPAAVPAAPAQSMPAEPSPVEEMMVSDVATGEQLYAAPSEGMRQRIPTTTSTSSDVGLGRIQLTLRYSQPRAKLVVVIHKCVSLVGYDEDNLSDPYVRLYLLPDKSSKKKTQVIKNDLNPIFDETFDWSVTIEEAKTRTLELSVKNKNSMFSKARAHMGIVSVNLAHIDLTQAHTEWYELQEPEDSS